MKQISAVKAVIAGDDELDAIDGLDDSEDDGGFEEESGFGGDFSDSEEEEGGFGDASDSDEEDEDGFGAASEEDEEEASGFD